MTDLKALGVDGEFDEIINSSDIGLVKPNREIFSYVIDKFKLAAHEFLLIDDKAENVAAAESLGIPSIHFRSLDQLKKELGTFS